MTPTIHFSSTSVLKFVTILYYVESLHKRQSLSEVSTEICTNVTEGNECKHTPFIEQDMDTSIPVLHSDEMSSRTDLNTQLLLPCDVEIKVEPLSHGL